MIDVTKLTDSQLNTLMRINEYEAERKLKESATDNLEYKQMIIQDQLDNLVPIWMERMKRYALPTEGRSTLDYILERKYNKQRLKL